MPMKLSEFINELHKIEKESLMNQSSHPSLIDSLSFSIDMPDDHIRLKLREIDVDTSMGCGCWIGASIVLELDDQDFELKKRNK